MSKKTNWLEKGLIVLQVVLLGIFFYWIFRYAMNRYFDSDEFAHLYWSHRLVLGERPYTDFFYFMPPFFLYTLLPLFKISGQSALILLLGRGLAFGIFLLTSAVLFFLIKEIKNGKVALLTVLVFVFLPIPSDKWIEIRPDGLSILLSLSGMYFLVKSIKKGKFRNFFLSGLFYAVAIGISPKMVFFLIAAVGVMILNRKNFIMLARKYSSFFLGFLIPVVAICILLFSYGDFGKAILLMTKIASEASKTLGMRFPISVNFLFYPNDTYYGTYGYSLQWTLNLIIWFVGAIWGVISLVSSGAEEKRENILIKLLVASSFIISFIAYIKIFPLKHEQYLLPLSPFIAYYFADLVMAISTKVKFRKLGLMILIVLIFLAGKDLYRRKLQWKNQGLSYYAEIYNKLPRGAAVVDLTGESIFTKSGYYFCCIPYGQYESALLFKYPKLEDSLREKQVKYIYVSGPGRLAVIPLYQASLIRQYYLFDPPYTPTGFMTAGTTVRFEKGNSEKEIDLIVSGNYSLVENEKTLTDQELPRLAMVDGLLPLQNPVYLLAGKHKINFSRAGELKVIYLGK
ncbi:glycosyltransferase family 39 protein [Candidatus Microgenomates bacterium]|nr:glycosyltransferase family 39 protein [Candidatus Microgenomates bacterium]